MTIEQFKSDYNTYRNAVELLKKSNQPVQIRAAAIKIRDEFEHKFRNGEYDILFRIEE